MSRQEEGARRFRNKSHSNRKEQPMNGRMRCHFWHSKNSLVFIVQFRLRTAEHLGYSGIRKIWKSVLITCLLLQVPVWGVSPPDVFTNFPFLSFFSENKYKHQGVKTSPLLAASWQHVFPPWNFGFRLKVSQAVPPFSDGFFPIKLEFAKNHFVSEKKVFPALTLFFLQSS